jgi:hypothetical protein
LVAAGVAEAFVELLEKVKIKRKNRTFKVLARDRRVLSGPYAVGTYRVLPNQNGANARFSP